MKYFLLAVAILFCAHSASVAGERDGRGSGMAHRGQHGFSGHARPSGGNWQNRNGYGRSYGNRGGGWGHRNDDFAGGILGGIIGGAIGSIFAPEPEPPVVIVQPQEMQSGSPEWFAYCTNRYKSFNPEQGTFTGYDGKTYPCR